MSNARLSQQVYEAAFAADSPALLTTFVVEAAIPRITRSPATPTGAGLTLAVVEAAFGGEVGARLSQLVVEVCLLDATPVGGGTLHETVSYGWAS